MSVGGKKKEKETHTHTPSKSSAKMFNAEEPWQDSKGREKDTSGKTGTPQQYIKNKQTMISRYLHALLSKSNRT